MAMRLLPAVGHRVMPWKNGGGETREIVAWPEGAGLDSFGWRISAATVASNGPFSVFPGIDRTLAILEGEGMDLAIGGGEWQRLAKSSPPLRFSCDLPAKARLVAGPVLDLNVMTRRSAFDHRVARLHSGFSQPHSGETTVIFCARGRIAVECAGKVISLGALDCAILDPASPRTVRQEGDAMGFEITILPVAR
jgi:uncharacterized protein